MNPIKDALLSWLKVGTMPIFGIDDAIIGGGLSLAGSLFGGSKASKGASRGAEQAEFNPYSIYSGIGSGVFDKNAKTGRSTLSAPYQNKRDYYLGQGDFFNSQLDQFRPPTRDQFLTGYEGGTAAEQALSFDQWAQGRGGNKDDTQFRADFGRYRPESYSDARSHWFDWTDQEFTRPIQEAIDKRGITNAQEYWEYARDGAAPSRSEYDDYLAGLNKGVLGDAQYDDEAFNEARAGYKSPEQRIYDRLFKLSEGNEALEKSGLESRLFAQGMLGSTGGAHRQNAQADAAYTRDLGRQQQAVTLAEEIQNQIQNRGIKSTNQALGIDNAGLENLRLGIGAGGGNVAAGQITAQNAANQGGAIANAFSAFGDNFSSGGAPAIGAGGSYGGSGLFGSGGGYTDAGGFGVNYPTF